LRRSKVDPAVDKHDQWSRLQRELEVSFGYRYVYLCLVAYSMVL